MAKRLLAMLLCVGLVLAALAGCTSAPAASTQAPATDAPSVAPEATEPAVVEKQEVTINWGSADLADPNADDFGKWIQSNFKVKINVVTIDSADKVKMLATSNTLPDLIGGMGIGDGTFNQLKSQSMIRDIPEDMLAKYPLLKKSIDSLDVLNAYKGSTGKNLWLPLYGDVDNPQKAVIMPFYYRADWAEKLGIATPATVDDYYNMLKAFTEKDPDGNGQNDTYGVTGWLWQVHFLTWTDTYAWIQEDGKWIPGFMSKNMLPALKFYNKLYQEKILDPEFANANAKSMFFTDKVGVMVANSEPTWVWRNIYRDFRGAHEGMTVEDAMKAVQFLPPLKATADGQPQWAPIVECYGYAISSATTDDVLDRILEIADWQLSPDGRDFMTYGFKDQDWIVKDGKAISILPNNPANNTQKRLTDVYPSCGGLTISMGYRNAGTPWLNPPLPQECLDRSDAWQEMATPFLIKENLVITRLSTPLKDVCSMAGIDAHEGDFQNLITSANLDVDYANLMKTYLETQGLQAAIDEVNKVVAEQGLDK